MKGCFITFEGGEGVGKTVQALRFAHWLESLGLMFHLTREPGGTEIGGQIRDVLLRMRNREIQPLVELMLFSADRADHVLELIKPALERGMIVVCDRYADSTQTYQGFAGQLDLGLIKLVTDISTGGLEPNFTFLLDLLPEIGLLRKMGGPQEWNRLDAKDLDFHRRVRQGYLLLAKHNSRFIKIDASFSEEIVFQEIKKQAQEKILPFCPQIN